jgi:hypothetical protein
MPPFIRGENKGILSHAKIDFPCFSRGKRHDLTALPRPRIRHGTGTAYFTVDMDVVYRAVFVFARDEEGSISTEIMEPSIFPLDPDGKYADRTIVALEEHRMNCFNGTDVLIRMHRRNDGQIIPQLDVVASVIIRLASLKHLFEGCDDFLRRIARSHRLRVNLGKTVGLKPRGFPRKRSRIEVDKRTVRRRGSQSDLALSQLGL